MSKTWQSILEAEMYVLCDTTNMRAVIEAEDARVGRSALAVRSSQASRLDSHSHYSHCLQSRNTLPGLAPKGQPIGTPWIEFGRGPPPNHDIRR